ncbi:acyl-[acyl-carrier-protein] thioesterase [Inconstantimicrobium mannanitabidum]|uniref:Acyl-ACP thioesterase n=1 Tax=Inconstantimicrobium mannanitabidum TaxID=1604901 RepID=A0ACB5RHD9_9CLOT|nr:acyl-ACP thioesterase domain-containing protein [Clostridium sp. TW13]GKX68468.1 acyl-ACP thioesterase [Clostridium sp. TW13]
MGARYEKEYEINYYNVDSKGNLKITSIADFLCDVGMHQSEQLGVGIEALTNDNIAWVFYKYDIQVIRYPNLNEKVYVSTEAAAMKKFYAYRNYSIKDAEGNVVITGRGIFLLIDIEKRRAIRVPDAMGKVYDCNGESFDIDNLDKKFEQEISREFFVRYSDIDTNGHVNNTRYMEWALEVVPRDIFDTCNMSRIKVNFLKEIQYGHKINSEARIIHEDDKYTIHHRITDEEGTILALCETFWQK